MQEIELDEKAQRFDFAADFLDEIGNAARGATGGEDVIHDDDALAGLDRIRMHLQPISSIFELIGNLHGVRGEFPRLQNGNLAFAELVREGRREDESSALDPDDRIEVAGFERLSHVVDRFFECLCVTE